MRVVEIPVRFKSFSVLQAYLHVGKEVRGIVMLVKNLALTFNSFRFSHQVHKTEKSAIVEMVEILFGADAHKHL